MKISCLVENLVYSPLLKGEHGLSLLLEWNGYKILFDTGQTGLFLENAEIMGLDLTDVKDIVLSHGHYDHTGGLSALLKQNKDITVYAHPAIWKEKYREDGSFIGLDLRFRDYRKNFRVNAGHSELYPGVFLDGDLFTPGSPAPYNKGLLVLQSHQLVSDNFEDEQYLILETGSDLVLITACSHRGIIDILDALYKRYGRAVTIIVGGLHTKNEEAQELKEMGNQLFERGVAQLFLNHCTGMEAFNVIKKNFSGQAQYFSTGMTIEI